MSTTEEVTEGRIKSDLPDRNVSKHGYRLLGGGHYYWISSQFHGVRTHFDEVEEGENGFRLHKEGVKTGYVEKDSRVPRVILGELRDIAGST